MSDWRDTAARAVRAAERGGVRPVADLASAGLPGSRRPPTGRPRRLPKLGKRQSDGVTFGLFSSTFLHAAVVAFWIFGLPELFHKKPPEETPIAVKLINEAEFTRTTKRNPKPVEKAKDDVPPPDTENVVPEPPKQDPLTDVVPTPPPPQQQASAPKVTTPPEPPKPAPVKPPPPPPPEPLPKPEPPKPVPPVPEPKPEPPKPVPDLPKVKPTPPKQDEKKTKDDQDFDQLLKNLAKTDPTPQAKDPPKPQKRPPTPQQASNAPNAPLGSEITTAQKDLIAAAVQRCWYDDPGARGNGTMQAVIRVWLSADATVERTEIVDTEGRMADPVWRAFAERARRAPLNPTCSKLPIPADKLEDLRVFTFTFTPQGVT
jgi:hypothetical protein